MNITPVIITCPGREAMLEKTLAALGQTDLNEAPIISLDPFGATMERKQSRQEHNSLRALTLALAVCPSDGLILFCEDDIEFNVHLRHNLERWLPLRQAFEAKNHFWSSLYNPTIQELERVGRDHYFIADPNYVYGSQCYAFSHSVGVFMAEHWWEVMGMQDIKMSRLAARVTKLFYHTPSLVQHIGVVSTFGGGFHQTQDYIAEFKTRA